MKIAFFTGTYFPQINGVVTSTHTFVTELEKRGHEVTIICPKMDEFQYSTDKVWRFRSFAYPFQKEHRIVSPFSRKLKQFKDKEFDIIQIQTPFFMGHLAQYLSWKYDIPMVHTYHTFWIEYLHYFPLIPKNFIRKLIIYLQRTSVTGVIML